MYSIDRMFACDVMKIFKFQSKNYIDHSEFSVSRYLYSVSRHLQVLTSAGLFVFLWGTKTFVSRDTKIKEHVSVKSDLAFDFLLSEHTNLRRFKEVWT